MEDFGNIGDILFIITGTIIAVFGSYWLFDKADKLVKWLRKK